MPHRIITDPDGQEWQVWETRPGPRSKVTPGHESGWITFELAGPRAQETKRRLAPIPDGWQTMREDILAGMIERARPVSTRRRSITQVLEDAAAPPELGQRTSRPGPTSA